MRCPALNELPLPPPGKTGWPWTEETPQLPATMPDGSPWPRISIVTPSFNQGQFIEETIRSVLLQGCPNLEYIIMDGGSTDDSVEIIKKYEPWLAYWVSEPDRGQSHAVNKGFEKATGEIVAWLNSDDVYLMNTVASATRFLVAHPEIAMVYSDCQIINEHSQIIDFWRSPEFFLQELLFKCFIPQQTVFLRHSALTAVGMLDITLHYALDYDLWLRLASRFEIQYFRSTWAQHRKHIGAKTIDQPVAFWPENAQALANFFSLPNIPLRIKNLEQDALGINSLRAALFAFQINQNDVGHQYIEDFISVSPEIVATQQRRILNTIVAFCSLSQPFSEIATYINRIFSELPEEASSLQQLKPIVLTRLSVIRATYSGGAEETARARRLIPMIILNDMAWLRERHVFGMVMNLLIGHRLLRFLVQTKNWILRKNGVN